MGTSKRDNMYFRILGFHHVDGKREGKVRKEILIYPLNFCYTSKKQLLERMTIFLFLPKLTELRTRVTNVNLEEVPTHGSLALPLQTDDLERKAESCQLDLINLRDLEDALANLTEHYSFTNPVDLGVVSNSLEAVVSWRVSSFSAAKESFVRCCHRGNATRFRQFIQIRRFSCPWSAQLILLGFEVTHLRSEFSSHSPFTSLTSTFLSLSRRSSERAFVVGFGRREKRSHM